jgi:hypothetical protein
MARNAGLSRARGTSRLTRKSGRPRRIVVRDGEAGQQTDIVFVASTETGVGWRRQIPSAGSGCSRSRSATLGHLLQAVHERDAGPHERE